MPRKRVSKYASRLRRKVKPDAHARRSAYAITIILVLVLVLLGELYLKGTIGYPVLLADSSIAISFMLTSVVFSYMLFKGNTIRETLAQLGLSRIFLSLRNIGIAVLMFIAIVIFNIALQAISIITNIPLPTNVQSTLAGVPAYFLVFTFLITPINEEIFFRGFLVSRFRPILGTAASIIISAAIFAALHIGYLSVAEFAGAFFFGLVAGYVFNRTRSLYPSIFAHAIVNLITITSLIYLGMFIHP